MSQVTGVDLTPTPTLLDFVSLLPQMSIRTRMFLLVEGLLNHEEVDDTTACYDQYCEFPLLVPRWYEDSVDQNRDTY